MLLSKDEIRENQIAAVFQQGLATIQSQIHPMLDDIDETECRTKIAHIFPALGKVIESHTREELETAMQVAAISLAVAKAIVWAETHPRR
jgi:hypothetical protein